ncbi:MAG: TadE/TadG family type IV pilus assembly protein [Planctomycetota bacterium]
MLVTSVNNLVPGVSPWWFSAVAGGAGLRYLVIAAVAAAGLLGVVRTLWNLARPTAAGSAAAAGRGRRRGAAVARMIRGWRASRWRLAGESGTATVEFVLVFPAALIICLILLQAVLMFTGNLFVNYAAYAAARAAIVQAPDGRPGGGGQLSYGTAAVDAVTRAAAYAMVPVSGPGRASDGSAASGGDGLDDAKTNPAAAFVAGLNAYYGGADDAPAWVENLAGARMRYALEHTHIRIYETRIGSNGVPRFVEPESTLDDNGEPVSGTVVFGPKDPVTLGVSHRLHLSVPYVSTFFDDGRHATLGGGDDDANTSYANVFATCTLTLEGYDRELPPLPDVEREN